MNATHPPRVRPMWSRDLRFRLAALLVLVLLLPACEQLLPGDPELRGQKRTAHQRVDQTLAGDRPDLAQRALHTFVQQIDAAEARGSATPDQIREARDFVDLAMVRIEEKREEMTVAQIDDQVATYLDQDNFGQARRYVRTTRYQLSPSPKMEARLLSLLENIEDAQIGTIEAQVEEDLAREAFQMASGRVGVALGNPEFSEAGVERLQKLQKRVEVARSSVPPPPPPGSNDRPEVAGLDFVKVPGGSYLVGSPADEPGRDPNREVVPETVHLREYFISSTEVTQEAFVQVLQRTWKRFAGSRLPAHSLSYGEAEEFCQRLTELDGEWRYSLPSEVEWEVAARARKPPSAGPVAGEPDDIERFLGALDKAALTLQKYGHFRLNKQVSGPMPVRQKLPNPLGLYDVHGNVAEWCRRVPSLDHWHQGSLVERPTRGGSILSEYERCRAGARAFEKEDTRKPTIGFRIIARRR